MKLKPSIRLSSRRSKLMAVAAASTAVLGVASFAAAQPTVHADPTIVLNGVGSDTIQDVMNGFSTDQGSNTIGSWNAVSPTTAIAHENIAYADGTGGVSCDYTRPNGSTEGLNAFRKSVNPGTTAAQLAIPPQQNCIDFSRSSSAPATADQKNDGVLVYVPFALDAVTTATGPATVITHADAFTAADLTNLYGNCVNVTEGGVTYNPNGTGVAPVVNINLYVPQPGSGTLKFWASKTGGWNAASPPACDHQTIIAGPNNGTAVEEHDGTAVNSDPNGMMPFSIAQWIAQSNGHNDRRHGATLHEIGGTFPCASPLSDCPANNGLMNTAFPDTREVYNVVQFSQVTTAGSTLFSQFNGTGSALCQDIFTIQGFGFALLATPGTTDNCGSTANSLRVFDATDPV